MEPLKALWTYMTSPQLIPRPRTSLNHLGNRVVHMNHRLAALEANDESDDNESALYPYVEREPHPRERRLSLGRPLMRRKNSKNTRKTRRHRKTLL